MKDTLKKGNEINASLVKKLKKGQEILVNNFETKESETSPPTRYNSGSIILAMENATRAEIIKKLEKIKYIQINTKTQIITPTKKGETIYDVVYSSMQDLLNPKLTASWEKGLDMVAKKQIKSNEFMVKLESYIKGKIDKLVIHM